MTNPTIESLGHSDPVDHSQSENLSNSITEGLSTSDDNFIAVDANDDIDLDQAEDDVVGIGTLGRVWSMNEVVFLSLNTHNVKSNKFFL